MELQEATLRLAWCSSLSVAPCACGLSVPLPLAVPSSEALRSERNDSGCDTMSIQSTDKQEGSQTRLQMQARQIAFDAAEMRELLKQKVIGNSRLKTSKAGGALFDGSSWQISAHTHTHRHTQRETHTHTDRETHRHMHTHMHTHNKANAIARSSAGQDSEDSIFTILQEVSNLKGQMHLHNPSE